MRIILTNGLEAKANIEPEELYTVCKLAHAKKIFALICLEAGGRLRHVEAVFIDPVKTFEGIEWFADTLLPPHETVLP